MTTPFENLIRATLTDLAEEAPTVHDQLPRAEHRARTRRRATVTMSAVGALAAVLIAAPIAMAASGGRDAPPAVPASTPSGPPAAPAPAPARTAPPADPAPLTGRTAAPEPPVLPLPAAPGAPVPAQTAPPLDQPRTGNPAAPAPAVTAPPSTSPEPAGSPHRHRRRRQERPGADAQRPPPGRPCTVGPGAVAAPATDLSARGRAAIGPTTDLSARGGRQRPGGLPVPGGRPGKRHTEVRFPRATAAELRA
ncbi:hypothetical protein ACQP1S_27250 [Micromonospora matsumotoense]|uniref:hypothetical protein n=1 Tax=Micromonospora matsumotoense TaxID=121616 RepID=UPI003D8F4CB9